MCDPNEKKPVDPNHDAHYWETPTDSGLERWREAEIDDHDDSWEDRYEYHRPSDF